MLVDKTGAKKITDYYCFLTHLNPVFLHSSSLPSMSLQEIISPKLKEHPLQSRHELEHTHTFIPFTSL